MSIPADVVINVSLLLFTLQPVFVTAHFEEAFEGVLASRVPRVHVEFFCSLLWLLDIVEDVIWEPREDLVVRARSQAIVESTPQICDKVVFLALLEGVELTS